MNTINKKFIYKQLICLLLITYCGSSSNENLEIDKVVTTTSTTITTVIQSELTLNLSCHINIIFKK